MEACTLSPAKSNIHGVKHVFNCNSHVNIDKSLRKLCAGTDQRIKCQKDQAHRELSRRNTASCAPTKNYLNARGQGLGDRNSNARMEYKSAQLSEDTFIS